MQQDIAAPETVSRDARCLAYVLVVLVVTDVLLINQDMWLTVPVACLACVLLLVIGCRAGLSLADVGLSRAGLGRGLLWGTVAALARGRRIPAGRGAAVHRVGLRR
ncbi:hypothetical protein [Aeromicrobium sp. UC242_57]|uniref:hypothetical protein n=1 Tax=Aeromicrobium sp. UC242_57 TaxID=3374624 RepID=UPI0037ADECA2